MTYNKFLPIFIDYCDFYHVWFVTQFQVFSTCSCEDINFCCGRQNNPTSFNEHPIVLQNFSRYIWKHFKDMLLLSSNLKAYCHDLAYLSNTFKMELNLMQLGYGELEGKQTIDKLTSVSQNFSLPIALRFCNFNCIKTAPDVQNCSALKIDYQKFK